MIFHVSQYLWTSVLCATIVLANSHAPARAQESPQTVAIVNIDKVLQEDEQFEKEMKQIKPKRPMLNMMTRL